jgi:hypothetical protein
LVDGAGALQYANSGSKIHTADRNTIAARMDCSGFWLSSWNYVF